MCLNEVCSHADGGTIQLKEDTCNIRGQVPCIMGIILHCIYYYMYILLYNFLSHTYAIILTVWKLSKVLVMINIQNNITRKPWNGPEVVQSCILSENFGMDRRWFRVYSNRKYSLRLKTCYRSKECCMHYCATNSPLQPLAAWSHFWR